MGLRVAMITRRYWPMVGGAETMMSNLAAEFRRQGAEPTIVTAQWRNDWPTQMGHHGTPVVRLPSPKPASWGVIRYLISLSKWLRRNCDQYDAVCVSRLQYDAFAAVTALKGRGVPILLRAEYGGGEGDCQWLRQAQFGNRIRRALLEADYVVAPSPQVEQELANAGFAADKIKRIANGLPPAPERTPHTRRAARISLSEANHDLTALPTSPVILCISNFRRSDQLPRLVSAFRSVADNNPNTHLWIVGDGPERDRVYRHIVDLGLHHQVFMPGVFDDLDDLMQAADVYAAPGDDQCGLMELRQAMSYGLPVIAGDSTGSRAIIENEISGLLASPSDEQAWGEALRRLTMGAAERARIGAAARKAIANDSIERSAAEHLQWLASREQ